MTMFRIGGFISIFVIILLLSFGITCKAIFTTEEIVELRWDFSDCDNSGRFGPNKEDCDAAYRDTNLDVDTDVLEGVQVWTVPVSGLYLVTARGPSGAEPTFRQSGKGAELTGEFHMTKGQKMNILVGQRTDFIDIRNPKRPVGGSGGTFIVRQSDGFVLMVAGGGSSGAGTKWNDWSVTADASLSINGNNGSEVRFDVGQGGQGRMGGMRGLLYPGSNSAPGGGAGFEEDGVQSMIQAGTISNVRSPRAAKAFMSSGVADKAPGTGGYFMYNDERGRPMENNGGFGGGGAASSDGGSGGGGGYSGGGGGPLNGWGGGGGSINNGGRQRSVVTNRGRGSVTISFIGHQCCGPVVVYVAMTFIAGMLLTILVGFCIYKISKAVTRYDGSGDNKWDKFKRKFQFRSKNNQEKEEQKVESG